VSSSFPFRAEYKQTNTPQSDQLNNTPQSDQLNNTTQTDQLNNNTQSDQLSISCILLTCGKHLHDRITSIRGEVSVQ
jgi:hypothetical protein